MIECQLLLSQGLEVGVRQVTIQSYPFDVAVCLVAPIIVIRDVYGGCHWGHSSRCGHDIAAVSAHTKIIGVNAYCKFGGTS